MSALASPTTDSSQDDVNELDIEIVTNGTSLVSDTINWTTQPSLDAAELPVPGAARKTPLSAQYGTNVDVYREHRFDSHKAVVEYYLDGQLRHEDYRVPQDGGNLQVGRLRTPSPRN
jgi:hypothetical protein